MKHSFLSVTLYIFAYIYSKDLTFAQQGKRTYVFRLQFWLYNFTSHSQF